MRDQINLANDELMNLVAGTLKSGIERKPFAFPDTKPQYRREKEFRINHLRMEFTLDPENLRNEVKARSIISFTSVKNKLMRIVLDAVELCIKEVRDASSGTILSFSPERVTEDKLEINLSQQLDSGEKASIEVIYEIHGPRKGMYFVHPDESYPNKPHQIWTQGQDQDSRYYFPCIDDPSEKATTEVIAIVPAKYYALSNGVLKEVRSSPDGRHKTYHWSQERPHSTYLVTLVVGEFMEIRDQFKEIPIQYFIPSGYTKEDALRYFGKTPRMIQFFEDKLGLDYPWSKYAQVAAVDFIFGGMENTSATTQTAIFLHDERAHLDLVAHEALVAHELAHQWFGDLLTCKSWDHGWLNEGFATYLEALWIGYNRGEEEFLYHLHQDREQYFTEDEKRYRRPISTRVYDAPQDLFDSTLYEKGSAVLHMLRGALGDDQFWRVLNRFVTKHAEGLVETVDLARVIEEVTGRPMDWFFDQWILKGGYPEFKITYEWVFEQKLAKLQVIQAQKTGEKEETPVFTVETKVQFLTSSGFKDHDIKITDKEHVFFYPMTEEPEMVRFDPGNWILKKVDFKKPQKLLIVQLKKDPDPMGRIVAAQELCKNPNKEVLDALREALLGDEFWGVQAEIASALGNLKTEGALDVLASAVEITKPRARKAVISALGMFKNNTRAADALIPFVRKDPSYFVEAEAATSIGKTKDSRALELLKRNLEKDSWNDVIRVGTISGIGALETEEVIPLLLGYTEYGCSPQARVAAVIALGKLRKIFRHNYSIFEKFETLIDDPEFRVRYSLPNAIASTEDPKFIPLLERAARLDLDGRIKRRSRETIRSLREGLEKGDTMVSLRKDLENVVAENRKLREKMEQLEARITSISLERKGAANSDSNT